MLVSHGAVPDLTDQVLRADQAVKAELFTADRRLIIAGCSYYWPESVFSCRSAPFYGAEETAVAAQLFDIGGNAPTATATGWRQLDDR